MVRVIHPDPDISVVYLCIPQSPSPVNLTRLRLGPADVQGGIEPRRPDKEYTQRVKNGPGAVFAARPR